MEVLIHVFPFCFVILQGFQCFIDWLKENYEENKKIKYKIYIFYFPWKYVRIFLFLLFFYLVEFKYEI